MEFLFRMLGVFFAMVVLDVCWVLYTRRTSQGRAMPAAVISSFIMLFSGYVVVSYTSDPRLLTAAVLGAFVGTLTAVRVDKAYEHKGKSGS